MVEYSLEIMEARHEQAAPNADVEDGQPGLGDMGIFAQEDTETDHESHQGVATPFLESEDAYFLAGDGLDAVDIVAGKPGKTIPEDQESQDEAT